MHINIAYSCDDKYASHCGISIMSLLKTKEKDDIINIFLVSDGITTSNRKRLQDTVQAFTNADIEFIDFELWKATLNLNMLWEISLSSYARLFLPQMLPEKIKKVIYLDCDTIICESLKDLFTIPMEKKGVAAVQDSIGNEVKGQVGLLATDKYFNAGVLLINIEQWKRECLTKKFLDYIEEKDGRVWHHDQGVLNHCFRNQWLIIHPKYNIMTIHYIYKKKQILRYYKENAEFYEENYLEEAKRNPVIIHYTPSFTSRPWEKNCRHPQKKLYREMRDQSLWRCEKLDQTSETWYQRLIHWKYRTFKK